MREHLLSIAQELDSVLDHVGPDAERVSSFCENRDRRRVLDLDGHRSVIAGRRHVLGVAAGDEAVGDDAAATAPSPPTISAVWNPP